MREISLRKISPDGGGGQGAWDYSNSLHSMNLTTDSERDEAVEICAGVVGEGVGVGK